MMCTEDESVGYFCEGPSFACMDWSFGSSYMLAEEEKFNAETGDNVYLGVGTFGNEDPMSVLGACFRITAFGVDRDLILQAVNTGPDVHGNQFDLQMGAGGMGLHNKCAGAPDSIFPGPEENWGQRFGGPDFVEGCDLLPRLPNDPEPMRAAGDDMVELCKYSFAKKVRLPPNNGVQPASNPTILNMGRVKCPAAITYATQLERSDDPPTYTFSTPLPGFPNDSVQCQSNPTDLAYCLTRMMDCKKPSAGYIDNIQAEHAVPGRKVVQPCTNDGYTRINVQCGCMDCYC